MRFLSLWGSIMLSLVWWVPPNILPYQGSAVQPLMVKIFSLVIKIILKGIGLSFLFFFFSRSFSFLNPLDWIGLLYLPFILIEFFHTICSDHAFPPFLNHSPDPLHICTHPASRSVFLSVKKKRLKKKQKHTHTQSEKKTFKQKLLVSFFHLPISFLFVMTVANK